MEYFILVIDILSSISSSTTPIILYIPSSISSTPVGPTCHTLFHSLSLSSRWLLSPPASLLLTLGLCLLGAGRLPAELHFAVSLVRSASLAFQGLWGVVIGVAWIPGMAPKGCSLDDAGINLRCRSDDSLHHAMAVVNLQFAWCMVLVTLFVLVLYVYVCNNYPAGGSSGEATTTNVVYGRLPEAEAADEDDDHHNCKQAVHDVTPMEIEV